MDDVTKVCRGCDVDLPLDAYTKHRNGKYGRQARCRPCRSAEFRTWSNREGQGEKTCEVCGVAYVTTRRDGRVCSLRCRWFINPRIAKECAIPWMHESMCIIPWASCLRCREWFLVRGRRRVCPSSECQYRAKYEPRLSRVLTCETCEGEFEARQGPARFCSDDCHRQSPAYKAGKRRARQSPAYRARKRQENRRRRARKRAVTHEPYKDAEVFERDGWRCQLCRWKVNRKVTVPHPRAPTIDHVIPLDEGGDDAPWNVQCAHFLCNSKKGNRTMPDGEQLLLIG